MKWLGYPGDRWSLARVYAAMLLGAAVGAALGYVVDLVIGSLLDQGGWWIVFAFGGATVGTTAEAVREFGPARPRPSPTAGSREEWTAPPGGMEDPARPSR